MQRVAVIFHHAGLAAADFRNALLDFIQARAQVQGQVLSLAGAHGDQFLERIFQRGFEMRPDFFRRDGFLRLPHHSGSAQNAFHRNLAARAEFLCSASMDW